MADSQEDSPLLALPEPCLLAVLRYCAADSHRSLFSAATAHSMLHQAAMLIFPTSFDGTTAVLHDQHKVPSFLQFLAKHGRTIDSMKLKGGSDHVSLSSLPPGLPIKLLQLESLRVQPQPGSSSGSTGVVRAWGPLKQLVLTECVLLDGADGLAEALLRLPNLERLSISAVDSSDGSIETLRFPTDVLPGLQQLTCLELVGVGMKQRGGIDRTRTALQPLKHLTGLVELKIGASYSYIYTCDITASMLSGMSRLTRLHVAAQPFESNALAGLPQLQHLALQMCKLLPGPAGGLALHQLLSQMLVLQQLTYLDLDSSCQWYLPTASVPSWPSGFDLHVGSGPPATAYAALTASTKLQHLCFKNNTLLSDAWQHKFPAGWRLPHLRSLDINGIRSPDGRNFAAAPDGSCLVSCCLNLQPLRAAYIQCATLLGALCGTELLASLQELSSLQTLHVGVGSSGSVAGVVPALCQLKGLQELHLYGPDLADGGWLPEAAWQLTELKHLTSLTYFGEKMALSFGGKERGADAVGDLLYHFFYKHSGVGILQRVAKA